MPLSCWTERAMAQGFWLSDAHSGRGWLSCYRNKPRGVPRVDYCRVISGVIVAV